MPGIKQFCATQLEKLPERFPIVARNKNLDDPVVLNAIYPRKEWQAEILQEEHRDAILLCGSSPDEGNYIVVFFERLQNQFATYSLLLGRQNEPPLCVDSQIHIDVSNGNVLGAGSLRLECDAPMRMWRMIYNGIMKDTKANAEVHARIACRFSSMSHTFEYPKHVPASKIIRALCDNGTDAEKRERVSSVTSDLCGYEQAVTFYMETTIGDDYKTFMLFGSKLRLIGDRTLFERCNKHYFAYINNGTVAHGIRLNANKCTGFGFSPIRFVQPLKKAKWTSKSLQFTIGEEKHNLSFSKLELHTNKSGDQLDMTIRQTMGKTKVKGETFDYCLFYVNIPQRRPICDHMTAHLRHALKAESMFAPLTVTTEMDVCSVTSLTGGKGSSLSVLSGIARSYRTFIVPRAAVLTTSAHKVFLRQGECQAIINEFNEKRSKCSDDASLNLASKSCVEKLGAVQLPIEVVESLKENLETLFGEIEDTMTFAVRSSALGEDSDETSAAGQMDTFLGVKGFDEICKAAAKCWASQYSFTALKYSNSFTQSTRPGMAVVVQEMVPADKAGIMFTCDPVTDNPNIITITANYGLGESVVSGLVEGDSVAVDATSPSLQIKNKKVGSKLEMIVQTESGGTRKCQVKHELSSQVCISDAEIIGLSVIGTTISKALDGPRDMEWAIHGDLIYLLQCRPVTTQFRASDFEITHDLSTSLYTNREILCRANYDEVLPGAMTPLTMSMVLQVIFDSLCFAEMFEDFSDLINHSPYTYQGSCNIGKRAFMNTSSMVYGGRDFVKRSEITMLGVDMTDHEALKKGIFHERKTTFAEKRKMLTTMYKHFTPTKKVVEQVQQIADSFKIDADPNDNSKNLLLTTLRQLHLMKDCLLLLMKATIPSQSYNQLTLKLLKASQDKDIDDAELMMLLSKLIRSKHDVESADIPKNLRALANDIRECDPQGEFVKRTPEDALKFLKEDEGPAGEHFAKFMKRHGYRCYKEFDLSSKTWEMDPLPLIKALQANIRSASVETSEESPMKLKDLARRPSLFRRTSLRWSIKKTQYAVYAREYAKAGFVKCLNEVRRMVNMIGAKMADEGRLPDGTLIHFLTVDEIFRLIETGCPTIKNKAIRRERLHDTLNREKLPVLLYGMPKPINEEADIDPDCKMLRGTPVSQGVIVGPARVIHNYETEAHLICKGDILITHATDTGWTPYFPLLGGVVTQIGGLISHGAVVAREYGLPAVVGVLGATQVIKSGDTVRLDGNTGTVAILDQKNNVSMSSSDDYGNEEHSTKTIDDTASKSSMDASASAQSGEFGIDLPQEEPDAATQGIAGEAMEVNELDHKSADDDSPDGKRAVDPDSSAAPKSPDLQGSAVEVSVELVEADVIVQGIISDATDERKEFWERFREAQRKSRVDTERDTRKRDLEKKRAEFFKQVLE